jgi:hypothetical protein
VWKLLLQKILIPMLKHSSDIFTKSIKQKTIVASQSDSQQDAQPEKDSDKILLSTPAFGGSAN